MYTQGKRGKGGGFVRATVKNLVSSNTFEKTFTSDENVEIAGTYYFHISFYNL